MLFVEVSGKAVRRVVEVGHRSASEAQILAGVSNGELIVVYPGEGIDDGVRVSAR
jgi:HlyD family secretion protein